MSGYLRKRVGSSMTDPFSIRKMFVVDIYRLIVRMASLLAGLCLLMVTFLGIIDISGRFILDRPLLGQVEITRILLVFVAFLGLADAESRNSHVRISLLDSRLSPKLKILRDRFVEAVSLAIVLLVTLSLYNLFRDAWIVSDRMIAPISLPSWIASFGAMIGFMLFFVEIAAHRARRIIKWIRS